MDPWQNMNPSWTWRDTTQTWTQSHPWNALVDDNILNVFQTTFPGVTGRGTADVAAAECMMICRQDGFKHMGLNRM